MHNLNTSVLCTVVLEVALFMQVEPLLVAEGVGGTVPLRSESLTTWDGFK